MEAAVANAGSLGMANDRTQTSHFDFLNRVALNTREPADVRLAAAQTAYLSLQLERPVDVTNMLPFYTPARAAAWDAYRDRCRVLARIALEIRADERAPTVDRVRASQMLLKWGLRYLEEQS